LPALSAGPYATTLSSLEGDRSPAPGPRKGPPSRHWANGIPTIRFRPAANHDREVRDQSRHASGPTQGCRSRRECRPPRLGARRSEMKAVGMSLRKAASRPRPVKAIRGRSQHGPLVMPRKGGAARAAFKVVGLPQREEKLIKDERHYHYASRGRPDILMPRILHS